LAVNDRIGIEPSHLLAFWILAVPDSSCYGLGCVHHAVEKPGVSLVRLIVSDGHPQGLLLPDHDKKFMARVMPV
jgi:hypothetical protein